MEVKNLIEYMEIVCGKIMSYPLESNHTDNKYLSQMNSIGKEFILRTSSQSGIKTDKKIPEELCEYIDQYYNLIFSVKISIPLENTGVSSIFTALDWPFSLIFSLARRNEGNFFQAVPTTLSSSLAEVRLASLVAWA